jgi:hypothetical protein
VRSRSARGGYRLKGNGRFLFGLSQALAALGREEEAETARLSYLEAWKDSDIELSMEVF